jgi:thioredoxin 1
VKNCVVKKIRKKYMLPLIIKMQFLKLFRENCLLEEDKELERIRLRKLSKVIRNANENKKNEVLNSSIKISDSTFEKIISDYPFVVVDCWAAWCAPCHMIAPIIEEMARDYSGKILFTKLNVDENRKTAMQYQIMSIPTLLVFKNGKLIDQIVGAMPRQIMEPRIIQHLKA